jgi:hypothetical protein
LLLVTIALTILLNTITQLLLTGEVTRPLVGLGLVGAGKLLTTFSWEYSISFFSFRWDDDRQMVLVSTMG